MIDNQFKIIYLFFADVKNYKHMHAPAQAQVHAHANNKGDASTKKCRVFIWSSFNN